MRHFRIDSDSALILSLTNVLLKQNGVTYTFIPDGNKENMGYKIGIYDIYVDETKFEIPSSIKLLEQYELIEIQRKVYDRLIDKNAEKSYSELFSKYKVIEEERNKYADEKLKEQRKAILEDVLEYYKADIENKIANETETRYQDLLNRFHKEECPIDEVCDLYKKYINAELKKSIENCVLRIFTDDFMKDMIPYEDIRRNAIMRSRKIIDSLYSESILNMTHKEVYDDIKKFKNDLVDNFMKVSGRERGQRDYWLYMKRAGKLADLIEFKLWEYYRLSVSNI